MTFRTLIFTVLAAGGLSAADVVSIEVDAGRIQASDLAAVMPEWHSIDPGLTLAPAPAPGARRRVPRVELERWARSVDLDWDSALQPQSLLVTRRMRRLGVDEASRALANKAVSDLGVDLENVQVALPGFMSPMVPAGSLQFLVTTPLRQLNRPVRVHLRWNDGEGRSGVLVMPAELRVRGSYAVAVRDLSAGEELSPSDIELRDGALPDTGLLSTNHWDGRRVVRQALKRNEPVRLSALSEKPLVNRGDLIELRVAKGAVRLRAPARAEGSGSAGDLVAFRNLSTSQRVLARVLDARTAEVASLR